MIFDTFVNLMFSGIPNLNEVCITCNILSPHPNTRLLPVTCNILQFSNGKSSIHTWLALWFSIAMLNCRGCPISQRIYAWFSQAFTHIWDLFGGLMLSGWIFSHYHPYPWLSTMCRNFIVKSLLTIIVLSCHDIHIFWSLFPLFGGYSVIYIIYYIIILLYYIYYIYLYHYSELFSWLHFVTSLSFPMDFPMGWSLIGSSRLVGGSCANWKNALLLGSFRVAVALGSVGAEDRQKGPGWSSKHIQIIPTIWVCLKIVYPYTQWLMIIIPTKWL